MRFKVDRLCVILAEVDVEPGDLDLDPGYTRGFMNIVTWAGSELPVSEKIAAYLATFRWKLLSTQDLTCTVSEGVSPGSELEKLIERARGNPNAIILGTLHSYSDR